VKVGSSRIAREGRLTNQTAPIPTTTIFTPTQTGLYRLSVYATLTKNDIGSSSNWYVGATYTDDSEQQQVLQMQYFYNDSLGMGSIQQALSQLGGPTMTFEAKAGTPIAYNVALLGSPDNSAYSLYYALERLE
jgi:hypothetical protein